MSRYLSALALAVLAAPCAFAQEAAAPTEAPAEAPAAEAPAAGGATDTLPLGQPVAPDGNEIGSTYVRAEFSDWDIRCIRTESGNDPCQLYQLLVDSEGNSVAEFAVFPLVPAQGEAIAGGTVVTPLETLLTEQVTLAVDGSGARRYQFTFCAQIGCVARFGYTEADITTFKRGNAATVTIVPVVAPDQRIALTLSLAGFTAAYGELEKIVAAAEGN